jgi:lambda family phage portal protein
MNWRQRLGAFIGGFDAGQHHRRLRGFQATRAHVNALIAASGPDITARARWLVRNNGYAVNAVESWAANTVGDGIKPISKIGDAARKEELQRLWLAWTDEADAEGLTDFYGLQRRAAREVFLAGEVFFRIRMRRPSDGLTVPLQLQMLPAEMLPLEQTGIAANGNAIRQGIEFDRIGRRVAYHFFRRHPGDSTDPGLAGEIVRVPASEVIHVIDPVEGGQLRGVSKLAPAIVFARVFSSAGASIRTCSNSSSVRRTALPSAPDEVSMCSKAGQMRWASAMTPSAAVKGSTRATARISELADFSRSIALEDDFQL